MTDEAEDDYPVGYGNPPANTRYRRGQSGNPKGRPKGSRNFATLVEAELDQRVQIVENGRAKSLSKRQVLAKKMVNDALKGNAKAQAQVIALSERKDQLPETGKDEALDEATRLTLDGVAARIRRTEKKE